MPLKKFFTIPFTVFLLLCNPVTFACTTAVISGKCTPDGRPLLYKQRDAGVLQNIIEFGYEGKFGYVGLVNSNDSTHAVWGGYNTAGFSIINAASYNLNCNDPANIKDKEGILMKMALQQCVTVEDFGRMLDSLPKPLGVEANFGVIDAKGGAAYFETGNSRYTKFDANDPKTAPSGYIIRTNFSVSGNRKKDKGVCRYMEEDRLFIAAAATHAITCDFLLQTVSRCLTHGITNVNLYDFMPQHAQPPVLVPFRDYIPRYITSATVLIQGVKHDEPVVLTTMWTILGSPLTSVAIPVWIHPNGYFPPILLPDKRGFSPLCNWALNLKKKLFPMEKGEGNDYLNLAALINQEQTGFLQKSRKVEQEIVQRAEEKLNGWRNTGIDYGEMDELYRWINDYASEYFSQTP